MTDLLRDAPIGQIIRWVTGNKVLRYPEEDESWTCPSQYTDTTSDHLDRQMEALRAINEREAASGPAELEDDKEKREEVEEPLERSSSDATRDALHAELAKFETQREADPEAHFEGIRGPTTTRSQFSRVATRQALSNSHTRADLEEAFRQATLEPGPSVAIVPTKLSDGTVLVDWYTSDDPANPQNWSLGKRLFVTFQICMYTTAVYMASSIYSPATTYVAERFGVNMQLASMGLSMYVLAYGLGPLIFAPLSELPLVGRNPPYMVTFALFVILLIPAAVVDNFPGLIVLRFLQGFFGSPCLATGGASLQDMFSLIKVPYVLTLWAFAATCGPALGPVISGFSIPVEGWRWSMWEILWLAGPIWLLMFLCLPETSPSNILLRRAQRLRKRTGETKFRSQSEIDQANLKLNDLFIESLWRPIQLMLLDPSIAFTAVYTSLIYGIYYSFFEAFPLVYITMYGFNIGQMGLTFLSITVGVMIAMTMYWSYIYWIVEPDFRKNGLGAPEKRLVPALFAAFLLPVGLFIFAWASNPTVHWIGSVIGISVFTIGIFIVIQCIFVYLPLSYPQYAASLFAGNDFARSTLATGAIHFSSPLFHNLGVDRGVTLLGGLTAGCILGVFTLYFYGSKLRARSRFAAK
ncbi:uncharacterized protein PV09_07735 [Verruconis gallopava]|uniref:Major facilitator superfamily (MFS) profile domain-containing protein n=1 Tax=Verruconis gallopava TaxID=253628 RepID=A0A0D2A1W6_9PEZI|nr:uncharacterized protein PV09_07735 [Verruconis gallopava]KIW00753.1 hypothetical protein PV09_07735 [Verruconis gallopava]